MKSSAQLAVGWLVLNLLLGATATAWLRLLPFNSAPDEYSHFHYNVDFIRQHHRLPVSGVDDLDAYEQLTPKLWGPVVSTYSYCVYPQLNYLVSAGAAVAMEYVLDWPAWRGARVASLWWGLVYLNALLLALLLVTRYNVLVSLAVAAAAALLPQVVYLCSYTNADIHSLASSALLALSLVYFAQNPGRGSLLVVGLASGLLLTAKLNYLLLAPLVPAVLVGVGWQRQWAIKRIFAAGFTVGLIAVALSGFWYVRNFNLYGDPLGMRFMLETMKHYGDPLPGLPLTLDSLRKLAGLNFHRHTFESLVGRFGYMTVALPAVAYRAVLVAMGGAGILTPLVLWRRGDVLALRWLVLLVVLLLAILGLHVANTLSVDYQPQGRYLFPGLVPLAIFLAWVAGRHRILRWLVLVVALLMAGLLVVSHQTLRAAYPVVVSPAVLLD